MLPGVENPDSIDHFKRLPNRKRSLFATNGYGFSQIQRGWGDLGKSFVPPHR